MRAINLSLPFVFAISLITGCAPRVATLQSGSLAFLKTERAVNVEYDYSKMSVGKFADEQAYVDERVSELEAKEAGRGEEWHRAWVDDRARRFQPKFETLLNEMVEQHDLSVRFGAYPEAKYTLLLKTTMTEPGWNVGIMRSPAYIDATATFVETQNRQNPAAVVMLKRSPGADAWGFDFDTGTRLQESYAKAGKELGKLIGDKLE